MTGGQLADLLGLALLLAGAVLCLSAAVGLVRFPDLFTRMHASSKPQVLGVVLVVLGIALRVREPAVWGGLALVALFHMVTVPVAAQMIGRAALRTGHTCGSKEVARDWERRSGLGDEGGDGGPHSA